MMPIISFFTVLDTLIPNFFYAKEPMVKVDGYLRSSLLYGFIIRSIKEAS